MFRVPSLQNQSSVYFEPVFSGVAGIAAVKDVESLRNFIGSVAVFGFCQDRRRGLFWNLPFRHRGHHAVPSVINPGRG